MSWKRDGLKILSKRASAYVGGVREAKCSFQGQEWKYLEAGSGEAVLCLHGTGGSKAQWRTFMLSLTKKYRVISPDIPAISLRIGFSDGELSRHNLEGWLAEFIETIGLDEVHIIGHSTGCWSAAIFAIRQPNKVKSLTLSNPPDLDRMLSGDLLVWEKLKVGFDSVQEVEEYLRSLFYRPPDFPEVLKSFYMKRIMIAISDKKFLNLLEKEVKFIPLYLSQLRNISQRTLLVAADSDVWSSEEWVFRLAEMIPNSKLVMLEQCGQRTLIEKPSELAEIYEHFISSGVQPA